MHRLRAVIRKDQNCRILIALQVLQLCQVVPHLLHAAAHLLRRVHAVLLILTIRVHGIGRVHSRQVDHAEGIPRLHRESHLRHLRVKGLIRHLVDLAAQPLRILPEHIAVHPQLRLHEMRRITEGA